MKLTYLKIGGNGKYDFVYMRNYIWIIKHNYFGIDEKLVKDKIIDKYYFISKDSYLKKYKNFIVEYTFKDREYRSRVTIYPEIPIYNKENIRRRM